MVVVAVPADGVKGKTWGPSTAHQKERGHIIPHHHDSNQKRWSKSAPNLEKPLRPLPYTATMTGLNQITAYGPEIGKWRRRRQQRHGSHATHSTALAALGWRLCGGGGAVAVLFAGPREKGRGRKGEGGS